MLRLLLLFCCVGLMGFAQERDSVYIYGRLKGNTRFADVQLMQFGLGMLPIHQVAIEEDKEHFRMALPPGIEPGVYRLQFSHENPDEKMDLIINGKEKQIEFVLNITSTIRQPLFSQSAENKAWYAYREQIVDPLTKIEALNQFLQLYPNTKDPIVAQAKEALQQTKQTYQQTKQQFLLRNKGSWAAAMVANNPIYFPNPKDDILLQDFYRREQYWNEINTSDPKLLNTPLYVEHILNYLRYYMNPDMHFSETEMKEGFIKSTDTIVKRFSGQEVLKQFAIRYLSLGFKEIGQEEVLQYLDEHYANAYQEQCNSDQEQLALEKRLAGYKALKAGVAAPPIELKDHKGQPYTLSDITQDTIIVAFWASWCPNCQQDMPQLAKQVSLRANYAVVAISLDFDSTEYQKAIVAYPNMIHHCDYKKWEGKIVSDYFIAATPTLIMLDKQRKIIGKYSSVSSLFK